jgi:hypothetical protein
MAAWQLAPIVVAWLAVGYKVTRVASAPSPAGRTLLAMLAFPAVAVTVIAPPVYRWLGDMMGVPNIGILIATTTGMVGLVPCLNLMLHRGIDPAIARSRARRRYGLFLGLAALQAFLWAGTQGSVSDPLFGLTQAGNARAVAYLMVHQAALAWTGFVCFRVCSGMARAAAGPLRLGLWTVALSGVSAVGVGSWNASYYAAALTGGPIRTEGWALISVWLTYVSVCALAVGVTVPDWGPRTVRRLRAGRELRRLEPLWRVLVSAAPEVELQRAYAPWDVGRRLHRRVVEIHDAELALRPWRSDDKASFMGEEIPAERRRLAELAAPLARAIHDTTGTGNDRRGADDLAGEVEALLSVARLIERPSASFRRRMVLRWRRWIRPHARDAAA